MCPSVDTLVIGGGAMGSAAAWHLAQAGIDVQLIERFEPGHHNGASHGASRNFTVSYSDPTYVSLLTEALPLWRELEAQTATRLLDQVGIVNHGANPEFDAVHEALTVAGIAAEFIEPGDAEGRWPGIRFDRRVLYTPQAGRLNADAAVTALQQAATSGGAVVRHGTRATRLDVTSDDSVVVRLETPDGDETITARRVVVTVGAWTQKLLGGTIALPRLVVTQEQPAHFAIADESFTWPGFNHARAADEPGYDYWYSNIYGMQTPGEGIKAGWHGTGQVIDPDARTFEPERAQLEALRRYAREWLPGADADSFVPISCTYTTTPDSDFVLDRVGPVVVGAGFSGHGFKFVPSIGRILADLALGRSAAPQLFTLARQR